MNLTGPYNTTPSIAYYKAQDRSRIFIAMKISEAEIKDHETEEINSKLLCCIK